MKCEKYDQLDPSCRACEINDMFDHNSCYRPKKNFTSQVDHPKHYQSEDRMECIEEMKKRFNAELEAGKEQSANAKAAKEEQKELAQKKKDIRAEIKELEAQLKALGLKAKESKEIKDLAPQQMCVEDLLEKPAV